MTKVNENTNIDEDTPWKYCLFAARLYIFNFFELTIDEMFATDNSITDEPVDRIQVLYSCLFHIICANYGAGFMMGKNTMHDYLEQLLEGSYWNKNDTDKKNRIIYGFLAYMMESKVFEGIGLKVSTSEIRNVRRSLSVALKRIYRQVVCKLFGSNPVFSLFL